VTDEELTSLFGPSIADAHVRTQLLPRLAGDPRGARGYVDYLVQRMELGLTENTQSARDIS
jgi:hypothetical protein